MLVEFLNEDLEVGFFLLLLENLWDWGRYWVLFAKLVERGRECGKKSYTGIFYGGFLLFGEMGGVCVFVLDYFGKVE
jgi:Na+/melibiose symporter-like transporter